MRLFVFARRHVTFDEVQPRRSKRKRPLCAFLSISIGLHNFLLQGWEEGKLTDLAEDYFVVNPRNSRSRSTTDARMEQVQFSPSTVAVKSIVLRHVFAGSECWHAAFSPNAQEARRNKGPLVNSRHLDSLVMRVASLARRNINSDVHVVYVADHA